MVECDYKIFYAFDDSFKFCYLINKYSDFIKVIFMKLVKTFSEEYPLVKRYSGKKKNHEYFSNTPENYSVIRVISVAIY